MNLVKTILILGQPQGNVKVKLNPVRKSSRPPPSAWLEGGPKPPLKSWALPILDTVGDQGPDCIGRGYSCFVKMSYISVAVSKR